MAGEGYPAGGGSLSAAQMLLRLTGAATLAAGALLYGDGDASLATLSPGSDGHVLTLDGGLPTWAAIPSTGLPGSYAVGDLLYASGASTLAKLAAVATGNALISGGVITAPAWGKIGLTTHVSGTLPVANGGTAIASYTAGDLLYATAATTLSKLGIGAANTVLTSSGSAPQWSTSLALAGAITSAGKLTLTGSAISEIALFNSTNAGGIYQIFQRSGGASILWGHYAAATGGSSMHADGLFLRSANGIGFGAAGGGLDVEITTAGQLSVKASTASTSTATGAFVVTGGAGIGGSLHIGGGTKTSDVRFLDVAGTWNSGAVAFTGWKLNVTDTASAAASLLLDLQVGGTSQFKVRKDSLLTLAGLAYAGAANGELWHDTTQKSFQVYVAGIQQSLSGCIFTATNSGGVNNTTSETSLIGSSGVGTTTLPANFWTVGKAVRITITGYCDVTGTPTLQLRAKLGSVTLCDTSAVTMSAFSDGGFRYEAVIVCVSTGGSGTFNASARYGYFKRDGTVNGVLSGRSISAVADTTGSLALDVTGQFSVASTDNRIIQMTTTVEVLN